MYILLIPDFFSPGTKNSEMGPKKEISGDSNLMLKSMTIRIIRGVIDLW